MRLAGIVILYYPEHNILENIASYLDELECLYVFDNSENPDFELVKKLKKLPHVQYISFGINKGISYALNTALRLAKNYKFLLTMDQDSRFCEGMMQKYKRIIAEHYQEDDTVAIFSVNHENEERADNLEFEVVDRAITSGSIVNTDIAKRIGGFDENLFIDEVDNEFCYRARQQGYKILYFWKINLLHHLGDPVPVTMLGMKFKVWNHSSIRKYYIIRNNIYVMKKYPAVRGYCVDAISKIFIKTILAEDDKTNKILYMLRGVKDAFYGKMGKLK